MDLDIFLLLTAVFLVSCGGTWGLGRLALRYSLLDVPNQRSSHNLPTPRGGGLALLLGFYLGGGYLVWNGGIHIPHILGLAGCGLGIAIAGFLDDYFRLSAGKRIFIHFLCVFVAVRFFISDNALFLHWGNVIPLFLVRFLFVVGLVWLLNLYNFMDGIDGLAGMEAISVALGAGIILFFTGETANYLPLLQVLAAASIGFLVWNWPPARIFMGDAGSGFLGFFFGIFALLTASSTSLNPWTWSILLGAFVVDATVTLMVRIRRGEKFYEAHRSHAYQILARRFGSHGKVTLGYMGMNWFFLFPLACLSAYKPDYGLFLVIFSYALLAILCILAGAGTKND
ncbi:MAG: glycosyltransferase family 4 protein [Desulfobulbaceae bacterium]|nr:glycosyltransferase family 4 protein [Desulfobulbaceae bacterium]